MQYKQSTRNSILAKIRKSAWLKLAVLCASIVLSFAGTASTAFAAGDASFGFSSGGSTTVGGTFTLAITETSSSPDDTNAVQANVSYPTAQLQYVSMSMGAFSICTQQTGGSGSVNVACASTSSLSGTQTVATVTFSVIGSGSAQVHMTSGSDIDNTSGTSVWNGTLTSTSYTFNAAASGGTSGGGTTGGGTTGTTSTKSSGSTSSGGSKAPTSTGGSSTSTTPSSQPTPTTTTTSPSTTQTAGGASSTSALHAMIMVTVKGASGQPVAGAKVTLDNGNSSYTNAQGVADFSDVATGNHQVKVTESGKTTTQSVDLTTDQAKDVSFKLADVKSASSTPTYVGVAAVVLTLLIAVAFGGIRFLKLKQRTPLGASAQGIVVGSGANTPLSQPTVPTKPATSSGQAYPPQIVTPQPETLPEGSNDGQHTPPASPSGGNPPIIG